MNERIDHTNYEAWLLDRLEGNLTPRQERELDAFLLANPDLRPMDDTLPSIGGGLIGLSAKDKQALKRTLPPIGLPQEPIDDHLIARLEGDLDPAQTEALRVYLIEHPEHQRAERLYALTKLVPEATGFTAKQELHRTFPPKGLPTHHNLDDFLVARLEGDLNAEQEAALSAWIAADPAAQHAWARMQRIRVQADTVHYADKASLKRRGKVVALGAWSQRLALAASVALLLGVGWWFVQGGDAQQSHLAAVEQKVPTVPGTPLPNGGDSATSPVQPRAVITGLERTAPNATAGDTPTPPARVPVTQEKGSPVPIEEPAPFLAQEPAPVFVPEANDREQLPRDPGPEAPALAQAPAETTVPSIQSEGTTVGALLASTFREKVLEEQAPHAAPLGADDAIAAVDKGLKAMAGDKAGLSVQRRGGRISGFDLRLGRNLAIAANR